MSNLKVSLNRRAAAVTLPRSQAIITIDSVNAQTDYGISGTTDLMTALKSVSDVGKRVIDEVSR
jgi:hypothetical protein